jgi:hypothetical protein
MGADPRPAAPMAAPSGSRRVCLGTSLCPLSLITASRKRPEPARPGSSAHVSLSLRPRRAAVRVPRWGRGLLLSRGCYGLDWRHAQ